MEVALLTITTEAARWLQEADNSTINGTATATTTTTEQIKTNSELLLSSLKLNVTILLVGLPIYCLLRIHYKRLFAV